MERLNYLLNLQNIERRTLQTSFATPLQIVILVSTTIYYEFIILYQKFKLKIYAVDEIHHHKKPAIVESKTMNLSPLLLSKQFLSPINTYS